jgi:hypothetical protein
VRVKRCGWNAATMRRPANDARAPGQGGAHLGRVVAEVVDDGDAPDLAADREPSLDALELSSAGDVGRERYVEEVGHAR